MAAVIKKKRLVLKSSNLALENCFKLYDY